MTGMLRRRWLGGSLAGVVFAAAGSVDAAPSPKKGVSLNHFPGDTQALSSVGVSWFYDWGTTPAGIVAPAGVSYVPMIWGADTVTTANLDTVKTEGGVLLGFNEPDGTGSGQAHMSVESALALWPQLVATGMRLGSPAVAANAQVANDWLDQFMTGAAQMGLRVDFICLHWYGSDFNPTNAVNDLQTYIEQTHAKYNLPIWVTEYALTNYGVNPATYPTEQQQEQFATQSVAMLESTSYVERYAWFILNPCNGCKAGDNKSLTVDGGALSPVGVAYAGAGEVTVDAGHRTDGGAEPGEDAATGSSGSSVEPPSDAGTASSSSGSSPGAEGDGGSGASSGAPSSGGCQCESSGQGAGAGVALLGGSMLLGLWGLRRRAAARISPSDRA